jgi:phage tail sheath gpL-like
MSASFDQIAATIRTPGVYVEENNRRAVSGTSARPSAAVLIGILGAAASKAEAELTTVPDGDTADTYFGRGSSLAQMCWAFKKQNPHTELWAVGLDNVTGTNATIDTVFTGTSTAAGTLVIRVCGKKISVAVASGITASALGDLIDTEIALAANGDIGVTSSNAIGTVSWTAVEDGEHGNHIRITLNEKDNEAMPAGLAITSGDDDYASVFVDTTNLGKLQDHIAANWGPTVKKEGHAVACYTGTFANTTTAGNAENSKHMTLLGPGKIPQSPWVAAAIMAGRIAKNWEVDPNRPMQNTFLVEGQGGLYGIDAPLPGDQFTPAQIETILADGIAPLEYPNGSPKIVRAITTYQTNASSVPDSSYMDTITMLNLMNYFYQVRARLTSRYPNSKAAEDGTSFSPGIAIVQPSTLRAEFLDLYEDMIEEALVQDYEGFDTDLTVEVNGSDAGRFDSVHAPRLVVGARVFAVQVQFILGTP